MLPPARKGDHVMVILKFANSSEVLPCAANETELYPCSSSAQCNDLNPFLDIVLWATMLDVTEWWRCVSVRANARLRSQVPGPRKLSVQPGWFATCSTQQAFERRADISHRAAMALSKNVMEEMLLLMPARIPLDLILPHGAVKGRSLHLHSSTPSSLHELRMSSRRK